VSHSITKTHDVLSYVDMYFCTVTLVVRIFIFLSDLS